MSAAVGFPSKSGAIADMAALTLCAITGLLHCNKNACPVSHPDEPGIVSHRSYSHPKNYDRSLFSPVQIRLPLI
jgi:hypothetical protein